MIEKTSVLQSSFILEPTQITFMPSKSPRMIWLNFKENDSFNTLYENIHQALKPYLIKPRHKSAKAHGTLARCNGKPDKLQLLQPGNFNNVKVDNCELWESTLTTSGSEYKSINSFPFSAKA